MKTRSTDDQQHPANASDKLPEESDMAFAQRLRETLREHALRLFEETARDVEASGIQAILDLQLEHDQVPSLGLSVRHPGDEASSYYRIVGDIARRGVIHQEFYADSGINRTQTAQLSSINQKVIDTHLAALLSGAFALSLARLRRRNPAGFW
nr:hypothetical protein [uncultured Pseudomonas sp.]